MFAAKGRYRVTDHSAPSSALLDPAPVVPNIPERLLLDLNGECNLRCPKCLLHSIEDKAEKEKYIGTMPFDAVMGILDEVAPAKPLIQPNTWGEPLLTPRLRDHLKAMKDRHFAVAMNTNGLTLNEEMARFMVEIRMDALFFSIDATTPETLKKVRGIDKLKKIHTNVEMALRIRGDSVFPRIGVTFTVENENRHEVEAFIAYWTRIVDVVRIGDVYADGHVQGVETPKERTPCHALYQTMPIHWNGDALICCYDSTASHVLGNVFRDGVHAVWHGEGYSRIRHLHETGQWDQLPFCKNCNAWAGYRYEERIEGDLLIRSSPQMTYYNRIDRLRNWSSALKGHIPVSQDD
ncbi:MAG: SPASM domain-containing protein [Rhodospirillales bacterium]|nr:SPASM domain-containing protein [Rhodospirillales bacterium]